MTRHDDTYSSRANAEVGKYMGRTLIESAPPGPCPFASTSSESGRFSVAPARGTALHYTPGKLHAMTPTRLLATALLAALTATAGATTITDIDAAPAAYADTQVTVSGTVTQQSIGYGGESFYTITDQDHRISVLSRSGPPAPGQTLQVSGRVGYRAPDEEFTFPPILVESARH